MKKNKVAFTLIELIVVSMIIVLISSSTVLYFFRFSDNREMLVYKDILENKIETLDKQVKNFQMSDYQIDFVADQNYYLGSKNNLGVDKPMLVSIDPTTLQGRITIDSGTSDVAWNYSIYQDGKEIINKITAADTIQDYDFLSGFSYEISGYLDGEAINTLFIDPIAPMGARVSLLEWTGRLTNKNNIITTQPNWLELVLEKSWQQQIITLD